MVPSNRRVTRATLVERVADELRERIIDGTFKAGEPLQQAALAKTMGVSAIPFREAVRMLDAEGFVEILPFKGARVKRLSAEEIAERVSIAFALENHAIELTLALLTEADLDRALRLATHLYPVADISTWHAQMSRLLGILMGAERWPVLFGLIMRNRMAARRYTEILVRRTVEDPEWAMEWAAGYFPRLIGLLRNKDLNAVRKLQRTRFEEYLALLQPWFDSGAPQAGPRRRATRASKAPTPPSGRR
jgi:DNA-binding GntR family transcriptional regulator